MWRYVVHIYWPANQPGIFDQKNRDQLDVGWCNGTGGGYAQINDSDETGGKEISAGILGFLYACKVR